LLFEQPAVVVDQGSTGDLGAYSLRRL